MSRTSSSRNGSAISARACRVRCRSHVLAELVTRVSADGPRAYRALTTIGCARLHNLWAWDDPALELDFLQLHSYPDLKHPERDADVFGRPVVDTRRAQARRARRVSRLTAHAGILPACRIPSGRLDEYLEFAVDAGYAGAWPWSFSGTDDYGTLPELPLHEFARRHEELVNPRCLARSS